MSATASVISSSGTAPTQAAPRARARAAAPLPPSACSDFDLWQPRAPWICPPTLWLLASPPPASSPTETDGLLPFVESTPSRSVRSCKKKKRRGEVRERHRERRERGGKGEGKGGERGRRGREWIQVGVHNMKQEMKPMKKGNQAARELSAKRESNKRRTRPNTTKHQLYARNSCFLLLSLLIIKHCGHCVTHCTQCPFTVFQLILKSSN